jgi:hypothetical protein
LITDTKIVDTGIKIAKLYKIDPSGLFHLRNKRIRHVLGRFILPENIDKITFSLVDFDTLKEYKCVANKTIFLHLGIPYDAQKAGYVFELRRKRQKFISI